MKKKQIIALLFFAMVAVIGFFYLQKSNTVSLLKPKYRLCDIEVDSFLVYRADSITKGAMMFSPLERNKIWVINSNNKSAELDLKTYQWTSLSQKYGDWFKKTNGNIKVITDNYENNVWLHPNFLNHGIWKYNKDTQKSKTFLGHIHNVVPDKDAIWLTYDNFIMRLDRKTEVIDTIKDIPTRYISTLTLSNKATELIINSTHRYDYKTKAYELIQDGNIEDCHRPAEIRCDFSMPNELQTENFGMLSTCDNEQIWGLRKGEIYSQKQSARNELYRYFWAYDQQPYQAFSDDENLYILFERDFLIINKAFLAKKCSNLNQILAKIKVCRALQDSLQIFQDTIFESFASKLNVYLQAAEGIDKRLIQQEVGRMKSNFVFNISQKYSLTLLNRNDIDTTIQARIYEKLIGQEVVKGHLEKAINYWDDYQKKLPNAFIYPYHRSGFELIRSTQAKLDSIDAQDLPEDEKLWLRGNALEQLCINTQWFEGNVFYNTELADREYSKLLIEYPLSSHADNIAYDTLMWYYHPGCGEYQYDNELDKSLEKFCNTYPYSEIWEDAMIFRAFLIYKMHEQEQQIKKQFEKSKAIYQAVLDRFPNNKEAQGGVLNSQAMIDTRDLQLKITSNRAKISPNGKVSVTIVLKNPTNRIIVIPLFSDKYIPNFELSVMQYQRNSCDYDPNIDAPSTRIDKNFDWQNIYQYSILPKQAYTETIELTEKAFAESQGLVKYQFSQKDKYTIRAYYKFPSYNNIERELSISSNQLSLIVE